MTGRHQSGVVQYGGDYRMDTTHQKPRLTSVRVVAIGTGMDAPFVDARKGNQRAVDDTDN